MLKVTSRRTSDLCYNISMSETYTVNQPVPFSGTSEERKANYATHDFIYYDEEAECMGCCCKPWHVMADYPCGTIVPRETVIVEGN